MLFARFAFARLPGVQFYKLLGTGTGEGFTPLPNTAVYAVLIVWPCPEQARHQVQTADIFNRYRRHARESWTVFLSPVSARGAWDAKAPFKANDLTHEGPVAALTRATIKPHILLRFWGRVPAISAVIGADPNVAFKAGLGEIPWFHQVTFSIWPDRESMAKFARGNGPHARAIKAVREGGWFSEELYARFEILGALGTWQGENPISGLSPARPLAIPPPNAANK